MQGVNKLILCLHFAPDVYFTPCFGVIVFRISPLAIETSDIVHQYHDIGNNKNHYVVLSYSYSIVYPCSRGA